MKAVIPTRYEPDRLRLLLDVIVPELESILILDNGHDPPLDTGLSQHGPMIYVVPARGDGIYRMWNRGRKWAGASKLAILNDDIIIEPGTLTNMADALDDPAVGIAYPGSMAVRDPGGPYEMTGFCFAFRGDLPVGPFDEQWLWWFGDTAFERDVLRAGFAVVGVPGAIQHTSDSEANDWARRPELRDWVEQDKRRWRRT